jgi:hypothetical protein
LRNTSTRRAYLAYTDFEIGRVIQAVDDAGNGIVRQMLQVAQAGSL